MSTKLRIAWLLLLLGVIACIFFIWPKSPTPLEKETSPYQQEVPKQSDNWNKDTLEQMIYTVSEQEGFDNPQLLIDLARHESVFLEYPKILDNNNRYSIGLYHFQEHTFNDWCVKKYQLPDKIENPVIQTKCAIRIIQDNQFEKLWVNSSKKISKGL